MNRITPFAVVAAALVLAVPVSTQGPGRVRTTTMHQGHEVVAGEVLVKYRQNNAFATRSNIEQSADVDESEPVGRAGARRVHSRRMTTAQLLASLNANPDVEYAEPNYILHTFVEPQDLNLLALIPNDTYFASMWGLRNTGQSIQGQSGVSGVDIGAANAWSVTTGSRANVVGVIDTGIDYNHPDLAANVWSAPAPFSVTISGVTINCAQGTHGFNAVTRTCNPMDDHNHGTHVSGTIGGVGNNGTGVTGVNWTASIIGGKFLAANGQGSTADAIAAIEFMIQAKAAFAGSSGANIRVLSNSWGGGGASNSLLTAINNANAADMLFVAAAGNETANNDTTPNYPSNYNTANMVAVAAIDNRANLASFSNYGATTVHLGAPGVSVLSTLPSNNYGYFSGTSMATPHVAGAAALLLSACSLNTANLKSALLASVDATASLNGRTTTGGRLNVNTALSACATPPAAASMTSPLGSIATQTPAYQWPAVANATRYQLYVQVTNGAVRHQQWYPASDICSGNACSVTPAVTLAAGTNHTAYVQTGGFVGNGPWSSGIAFTTPGGVPAAATVSSPSGTIATQTPAYQWAAVANAIRYQLYVQVTGGAVRHQQWYSASDICSGGTCSVTPAVTLAAGTNHTTYVQTGGSGGNGPWSAGLAFTTSGGVPAAATLTSPSGAIGTVTPTFVWNVTANATRYQLYVQVTGGAVRHQQWYNASDICNGSACSVAPGVTLASGTGHTFYVQTSGSGGNGPWSAGLAFSTPAGGAPAAATLTSPSGSIATNAPTFVWNAVSGATRYQLYVQVTAGGVVHQRWYDASSICSGSSCSINPGLSLATGSSHTFYVQSFNTSGYGPWSSGMAFTPTAGVPGRPTLLLPNGAVSTGSPTFSWTAVSGATAYQLYVEVAGGSVVHQRWYAASALCDASTCSVTPGLSLSNGNYRFYVQAYNTSGYGAWTSAMSFAVNALAAGVFPF